MAIDFTTVLLDMDNEPFLDQVAMQSNGNKRVILTLGRAVAHALMVTGREEPEATQEEKFYRGMLAFKVRDNYRCELKAEDIALFKAQIAKLYSPIIVYRSYLLLDPVEAKNVQAEAAGAAPSKTNNG